MPKIEDSCLTLSNLYEFLIFVKNTNWPMLQKQKISLLNEINNNTEINNQKRKDLEGIVGFLDDIQDYVADNILSEKQVFES